MSALLKFIEKYAHLLTEPQKAAAREYHAAHSAYADMGATAHALKQMSPNEADSIRWLYDPPLNQAHNNAITKHYGLRSLLNTSPEGGAAFDDLVTEVSKEATGRERMSHSLRTAIPRDYDESFNVPESHLAENEPSDSNFNSYGERRHKK